MSCNVPRRFLRLLAPFSAIALVGCPLVPPGPQPTASPSLDVNVLDHISGTRTDITGNRSAPTPSNPYQYFGIWHQPAGQAQFDVEIGVRAHDPTGVQMLQVGFDFYTCGDSEPLYSYNNGATHAAYFTLTSTPGPQNGGQAPTDLVFPVRITTTDLKTVLCNNGQNSSGIGTIEMFVQASNFSSNPNTANTSAIFDLQLDDSPIPHP